MDFPLVTPHLNPFSLEIRSAARRGRGVYATKPIAAQSVIEISPCLLFSKEEYEAHGKHTLLDQYTFVWGRTGQMALALGLGSLFNHSANPNVSYSLQINSVSIKYTTTRPIEPDEELCIFYTHNLWFDMEGQPSTSTTTTAGSTVPASEDALGEILNIQPVGDGGPGPKPVKRRPQGTIKLRPPPLPDIVPPDQLPFTKVKAGEEDEEEDLDAIQMLDVWVVDLPDAKWIPLVTDFVRVNDLDSEELGHLKRIRKTLTDEPPGYRLTMIISTASSSLPPLPTELGTPSRLSVPRLSALTEDQLRIKSAIWPIAYTPNQRNKQPEFTKEQVERVGAGLRAAVQEALKAKTDGQLPIAACLLSESGEPLHAAHDTRTSTRHPLRHAVLNLVRSISSSPAAATPSLEPLKNGQLYLLTDHTLYLTHEPCVMCTMAMVHSRVKEVFYIFEMSETGGCGGCATVTALKGINHRFKIWKWEDEREWRDIQIGKELDA